jgi:D-glycero-D-manno-heptose 1,7-bisphosphate phosphatase
MTKAIFIDRDGVINKDPGGWTKHSYVTRWEDFVFLPGSKEAIKRLNDAGLDIVVISNQAGIAKGHYSETELSGINKNMLSEINRASGKIKKVYYCIHQTSDDCDCRKPKIGLFRQAERELNIKARDTYFIGDGKTDVEAGREANLRTILVLSGKTSPEDVKNWEVKPDHICKNLSEAADLVLKGGKT